ncbi:hypothetical protein ASPWEDRAFT_72772 [Aspergillus wentii DTO 134E9]|uniref:Uncharacterized protein n=1 Tax=Aspergillus wentii DTO 134E9 TaxID=1073089 RepID=A0A1L9R5Z3_ASPWE|nr:uncharacterized protein ASPWEDRAFT_72772 [Aspergillus wentii DTO 134E9]KAI9925165.1 hypothetical protein MW887_006085 [Aspergillus wentii]OJJ30345.1 hypothetical protein ASPWEDRAFT_72772 [Aspergillus wentii DTO 134E9]
MRNLRSTPRRKRDTTNQSVDFLNGVNSTGKKNNQPHSRLSRSTHRATHIGIRASRNGGSIWDLPTAEEDENIGTRYPRKNEPHTPRRSSRIKDQVNGQNTPVKTPYRHKHGEDEEEDGDGDDDDDDDGESSDGVHVQLFSDDNVPGSVRSTRFSHNLEPHNIVHDQGLFVSWSSREDMEVEQVPNTQLTQNEVPDGSELEQAANQVGSDRSSPIQKTPRSSRKANGFEKPIDSGNGMTKSPERHSSRLLERNAKPGGLSSLQETRSGYSNPSRSLNKNTLQQDNEDLEDRDWNDTEATSASSNPSDDSGEVEEESFMNSPVGFVVHEPQTRPSNQRQEKSPHQQIEVQIIGQPNEQHNEITESAVDATNNSEEQHTQPPSRLLEFINLSPQKRNLALIISTADSIGQGASSSAKKKFKDIIILIQQVCDIFKDISNNLLDDDRHSHSLSACDSLLEVISSEGEKILNNVYRQTTRLDKPSRKHKARELLSGFEACVVPEMVTLITTGFEAYCLDHRACPAVYYHLLCVLESLLYFSKRISSLGHREYTNLKILSRAMSSPLQELIEALKSDELKSQRPESSDGRVLEADVGDESRSIASDDDTRKEWTEDETWALILGLDKYQGPNRYIDVMRHFGHRLRGRTFHELRIKAREILDNALPSIQDDLQTVEGRRKHQWLLSVRDDN